MSGCGQVVGRIGHQRVRTSCRAEKEEENTHCPLFFLEKLREGGSVVGLNSPTGIGCGQKRVPELENTPQDLQRGEKYPCLLFFNEKLREGGSVFGLNSPTWIGCGQNRVRTSRREEKEEKNNPCLLFFNEKLREGGSVVGLNSPTWIECGQKRVPELENTPQDQQRGEKYPCLLLFLEKIRKVYRH